MARPVKQTVEYFPHDTDANDRRTLTIIQSKYGNDGYAFWFKLLQLLGRSPGLYYDYNNVSDLEFLCAKTHQKDTETVLEIINLLANLDAIDKQLHENRIIWCQNLVDRVEDAFKRTIEGSPKKPIIGVNVENNAKVYTETLKNDTETTQRKGKEIKVKETKDITTETLENYTETPEKVTETPLSLLLQRERNNSEESLKLANLLKERILTNDAKAKIPTNLSKWAEDIDKINRLDGRTFNEISQVIEFCQQDDFWKSNILSGNKLRQQFTALYLKMKTGGSGNGQQKWNTNTYRGNPSQKPAGAFQGLE